MHAHIGTGSFQAITQWQNVLYGVVYYLCCHSFMSDSLQPHRLEPARLLCPRDFPGKNTGVGCRFLLQGIFPTQRSNLCLLHLPVLTHGFFTTSATWETPVTVSLNSKFFSHITARWKIFSQFYLFYIYVYILIALCLS